MAPSSDCLVQAASAIPRTSPERLSLAGNSAAAAPAAELTVFYLAYGSNLSSHAFFDYRRIRPISAVPAVAPTLEMTFNIPGLPYHEPCYANVAFRKPPALPIPPPTSPFNPSLPPGSAEDRPTRWDKGLIGVVYEVTLAEYARISSTEYGYDRVTVPCFALPVHVPSPADPTPPKPFLAHTLLEPVPPPPSSGPWWRRLVGPVFRPEMDYAQPSARYLGLLRAGAAEHNLPAEYRRHLDALQAYQVTSRRQRIGRAVLAPIVWLCNLMIRFVLPLTADSDGNLPLWARHCMELVRNLLWILYDSALKPVFGDGERTRPGGGQGRLASDGAADEKGKTSWVAPKVRRREAGLDEEKQVLLLLE